MRPNNRYKRYGGVGKCHTCGQFVDQVMFFGHKDQPTGPIYWSSQTCSRACYENFYRTLAELEEQL